MPQRTMTAAACGACMKMHGKDKSPCFTAHLHMQSKGCTTFDLVNADKLQSPCIFAAEWWEIGPMVKNGGGRGLSQEAQSAVKTMADRYRKYKISAPIESPEGAKGVGFVESGGRGVWQSGDTGVWLPVKGGAPYHGPDFVFLAGYQDPAVWNSFLQFYKKEIAEDLEGWGTSDKLAYTLKKAAAQTPGELGAILRDMAKPENIAKAVAIFAAFAALGYVKIGLYIKKLFAITSTVADLTTYARLLWEAANGVGQAKRPADLDRAAEKLAHFMAGISKDAVIAGAGYTVGTIAQKFRQWWFGKDPSFWEREAEEEARKYHEQYKKEKEEVHGELHHLTNSTVDGFVQGKRYQQAMQFLSGMQRRHMNNWATYCKRNKKILIMRTANEESLWRREMSSVLGKPVTVKFKSCKKQGHKWVGLVCRPSKEECTPDEWKKIQETCHKLEKHGFWFAEDPETGMALVLKGRPPKAFTSDYDKMGIYQRSPGSDRYTHDPRYLNGGDGNPANQRELNRHISPEKEQDQHGCQDTFIVKEVQADGQVAEVMGLQPSVNESFLIVDENGHGWIVPNLAALKQFYVGYLKVPWPYKVP